MKPDRRTLLIGAAVVAAATVLSVREEWRPACVGGSCCVLPVNLSLLPTNAWAAVAYTNPPPGATVGASFTNRQQ